uniref:Uncharacterized protein n=1 Tax=Oryza meridionalis TaxID=40149 RepID=A0A0E0EMZ1_9ORYZ
MVDWIRLKTFLTSDELFMNRNAGLVNLMNSNSASLNSWRRRKYQNVQVTDKSSIDELQFDSQSTRPLNKKAASGGFQGKLQKILRTSLAWPRADITAFLGHTMWPTDLQEIGLTLAWAY